MGLWYPKDTRFELTAFSDSDHADCVDSRKSTSGGIQFLGGDKLVSWSLKKQDCTSMYSVEAEYVSLFACCAQVLWMRTQLTDYGFYFDKIPIEDGNPARANVKQSLGSLNAKTLNVNFVCVTCGKCMLNDNHDKCVLHYLNAVDSRTKMPMAVPISTREPKRSINQSVAKPLRRTVASESNNQKPRQTTRKLYESFNKTCSLWYPKFPPPGYKWKPKS
uniref:Uncharacterized mitochondrial protein AtMg00810-like n=1 Tax=Tanacetum cinerariifolium TaxID=118510 RepID=A0A6L2MUE0_TANCI|nr:uncharacterized mitochondrial protein AtMg00810-like [Tanacetum cinerariifolium]